MDKHQILRKIRFFFRKIYNGICSKFLYLRYKHQYKFWDGGYKPKFIPFVATCMNGDCMTHFPQFSVFEEDGFKKSLEKVIKESEDENSYFRLAYENWEILTKNYQEILTLLNNGEDFAFPKACDMLCGLMKSQNKNYIYRNLFLSPRPGTILEFQPCCR